MDTYRDHDHHDLWDYTQDEKFDRDSDRETQEEIERLEATAADMTDPTWVRPSRRPPNTEELWTAEQFRAEAARLRAYVSKERAFDGLAGAISRPRTPEEQAASDVGLAAVAKE